MKTVKGCTNVSLPCNADVRLGAMFSATQYMQSGDKAGERDA